MSSNVTIPHRKIAKLFGFASTAVQHEHCKRKKERLRQEKYQR